jgi:hypothetical protein
MVKRPTLILLVIFALVVVTYVLIKSRNTTNLSELTPTSVGLNLLMSPEYGTLQAIRIVDRQNQSFQMQRDTSGVWIITQPMLGNAEPSLVAAAETQVGALRIVSLLENQLNLADAGLDIPTFTMEFTFANELHNSLEIGNLTPSNSGYYVRVDGGNLYVVSQSGIDALLNLLSNPPYSITATPAATFEGNFTPTFQISTSTPQQ